MSLVALLPAICSTVASVVGILLNIYVLFRLRRFARAEPNRFEYGCGLPLLAMAMADLLALVAFLPSMFSPFILVALEDYPILQTVFCKVSLFLRFQNISPCPQCRIIVEANESKCLGPHPLEGAPRGPGKNMVRGDPYAIIWA
jgi:hypothetical protein